MAYTRVPKPEPSPLELEELPMSEDLIKEILGMSRDVEVDVPEPVPEPIPEPEETVSVVLTPSTEDLGDGKSVAYKPFEEVFGWEPKIPHLVAVYEGYEHEEPMEGYIIHKAIVESVSLCDNNGLKANMTGPTGCGKTQLAEWYAAKCGRPFMRISHTEAFDKTEVFGRMDITEGETVFTLGVLPQSFDTPFFVLLDELTLAPAGALMVYGTLLDRRHLLLPEMKTGGMKPLEPCKGWSVIAADNTKGNGDGMDRYISSNVQDSRFLNRFDVMLDMDYLSEDLEKDFIQRHNTRLTSTEVGQLALVSKLLHTGVKDATISTDFSPRNLMTICKLVNAGMTMANAFHINYLSRVVESEVQDIRETYRSVTGIELPNGL